MFSLLATEAGKLMALCHQRKTERSDGEARQASIGCRFPRPARQNKPPSEKEEAKKTSVALNLLLTCRTRRGWERRQRLCQKCNLQDLTRQRGKALSEGGGRKKRGGKRDYVARTARRPGSSSRHFPKAAKLGHLLGNIRSALSGEILPQRMEQKVRK